VVFLFYEYVGIMQKQIKKIDSNISYLK
jgi:hypothetical protein